MTDTEKQIEKPTCWAHGAARASWMTFVIVFVTIAVSGRIPEAQLVVDLIGICFAVIGIISGVLALFGISKHGIKKILWPSMVGIILNGFSVFIWVVNFMREYNATK